MLLSDEEVRKLAEEVIKDNAMEAFEFAKKLLEAQHAKDQKRIEQVFEEIEAELEKLYEQYNDAGNRTDDDSKVVTKIYLLGSSRWQAIKSKYLAKIKEE